MEILAALGLILPAATGILLLLSAFVAWGRFGPYSF